MAFGKKPNWEILKKKDPKDSTKFRDVYEDQQLERSDIDPLQSITSRLIVAILVSIIVFFLSYFLISMFLYSTKSYHDVVTGSSSSSQGSDNGSSTEDVVVHPDSENPFFGYGEYDKVTDVAEKWFDKQGDGKYSLKPEYDFWNDTLSYWANELPDVVASCYYNYRIGNIADINTREFNAESETNVMTSDNPFYGYADMNKATDIAKVWFNKTSDGKYTFKDEYNFWNDNTHYWAYELSDAIASKYQQYEVEYNGAAVVDGGSFGNVDTQQVTADSDKYSFAYYMSPKRIWNVIGALLCALLTYAILYTLLKKNLDAQNMLNDTSDINQYKNDQHIALPEEVQRKFDWFPDAGAHCNIQATSMISHVMLSNKGINLIPFAKRYSEDVPDGKGGVDIYKGEPLLDDEGNIVTETVELFDKTFADDLYETSGVSELNLRKYYDTTKIPYNGDGKDRTKQGGKQATVAQMINETWYLPLYEPQRPAGAFLVDTEPVNTMVLAITRAGKGQTVIEPTIDMWTRENRPGNMVINDPKGELLLKFYVRSTVRGFEVIQFNLINPMKTDIYNPLGMAALAAREGDITKCAMYVENIATVFFPLDGGEDPVWPNAANNAFKRAAYGLIDYYMEEDKELRMYADRTSMDTNLLESKLDELWGKVTLYNCYQLFVQLTSKKMPNPAVEWQKRAKNHEFDQMPDYEYQEQLDAVNKKTPLWENKPEADLLTLYFNATAKLPRNQLRTQIQNTNDALRAMAGAEKMMASVYGIAITAMSFFTDPTISTLTSGRPSQNVDLAGISFPRCLGVRFHSDFIKCYHLMGMEAKWDAFQDIEFKKPYGTKFNHSDMISREGWAKYYFEGIFPVDVAYLRLRLYNPNSSMLIRTFYFQFTKSYRTSLDGLFYLNDPVLGNKLIKDGVLIELKQYKRKDESIVYKPGHTCFDQVKIRNVNSGDKKEKVKTRAVISTISRYSEKPKQVFLVTPPHLKKYAKLILILIKQLVDFNFDQSYMTKSNQKPLYKTRFMLDELGNLQSEGQGIDSFQTMLSIGLGQEQQFTLILQTLQQLRDVYGESADKIIQGNTSNIVFLKSTDDAMLDTLQKMSGTTHKVYKDSKTVTRDMERIWMQNEGKVSYTMNVREIPVITYNDMAFINERNSILFRAGDSPIWNRNETILPMAWRLLHTNSIKQPGKDYDLRTVPSLSTAIDFDVRKNQPDFIKLLDKRMSQAYESEVSMDNYKKAYSYSDYDVEQLDSDVYADEIMDMINNYLRNTNEVFDGENEDFDYMDDPDILDDIEDNEEVIQAVAKEAAKKAERDKGCYAGRELSRSDLFSGDGKRANHSWDVDIIKVYGDIRGKMEQDSGYFTVKNGSLYSLKGEPYIIRSDDSETLQMFNEKAKSDDSRVFAEDELDKIQQVGTYIITDDFYKFLVSLDEWCFAEGEFERGMKNLLLSKDI